MGLPIEIEIWRGEIAELEVDAIVVPANESLFMTASAAAALKRRAGDEVESAAVAQGPIAPGGVVVTGGGRLVTPYIIHAVGIGHELRPDEGRLREAIRGALAAAEHLSLRRIAIAPIGTERGVFAPEDGARLLIGEIITHAERRTGSPESVVIAVTRQDDLTAFAAALESARAASIASPRPEGQ